MTPIGSDSCSLSGADVFVCARSGDTWETGNGDLDQESRKFAGARDVRDGAVGGHRANLPLLDQATIRANSNAGHDFTQSLTDTERWAIIEYLKTL